MSIGVEEPESDEEIIASLVTVLESRERPLLEQVAALRERLPQHWLYQMECNHADGTDRAFCSCGVWNSGPMPSVGDAAKAWSEHALASTAEAAREHDQHVRARQALEAYNKKLTSAAIRMVAHEVMAHDVHKYCNETGACVLCDLAILVANRARSQTEGA